MKIVFLARYLPAEGSTTHMYAVAENLCKRGHQIYILSRGTGGEPNANLLYENAKAHGVQFVKLPFPLYSKISFFTRLQQLIAYIYSIPIALFQLYRLKPNVIHAHYPVTTYVAAIYRYLTGKKFIVTHHNMNIPKHIFNRKGNYAIAISRELETSLRTTYEYKKDEIKLIFNGVKDHNMVLDATSVLNLKQTNGIPTDVVIFGFVGTISTRKGVDVLIEAFSQCKQRNLHLIILGDGNVDWLKGLISKYKVQQQITLIPFRDPLEIYNMIDVLILPSRVEGFPLVPLEAMMMKKPVIRSDIEGAKDQIIEGENGYLFESENVIQLSNIIDNIAMHPEKLRDYGENAYDYVSRNFSEDLMVDQTLQVYHLAQ
ncbi:glycosyltransferase family 4 protein [Winogradskyella sediminis]|uniref:glycosyltransferase family 4 protein n=1 Tax=Winogradskyella sediminis TaxID=1382466 RepID=UPI000E22442E|nr:glycosyltransferase family 4 protein [Winogradskyella sediminis]REG88197.1 glycosyltransferase involved in cell wall biosynthesis [Winogradskyella sediminis]